MSFSPSWVVPRNIRPCIHILYAGFFIIIFNRCLKNLRLRYSIKNVYHFQCSKTIVGGKI